MWGLGIFGLRPSGPAASDCKSLYTSGFRIGSSWGSRRFLWACRIQGLVIFRDIGILIQKSEPQ